MTKNILIRYATLADLETIKDFQVKMEHAIEENPKPDEIGEKGVEFILSTSPEHGFYLVAEINKEVVGCLRISYERSVSSNGFFWWIQNVFVADDFREKGVFQKLYQEVISIASKNQDIAAIKLHVHTNNHPAIKAYEKAGMERTPEFVYIKRLDGV